MRGRHVERRFGWDTHGLPAELEAMSQLGIKTKEEILELGIETFNAKCRDSVMKYAGEWQEYVTRQARWVDFENDYKTLNPTFMESVLWAFKTLYDKGLVYEGFRCLPYCWNDQTPLSNHELRMDEEVYKNRQDPAVTVGYRLETGELALIWTTTPWTLPSNLAMAVRPDIDYVVVESDFTGRTERYLLAEARLAAYARELGDDAAERVVERLKGSDLVGRPTPRRSPTTWATRSRTSCSPPTTSPPTTAPASCTSPRPSVRRTSSSPTSTASRRSCPSAPTAGSPSRSPTTRACTSSTPTRRHRAPQGGHRRPRRPRLGHRGHRAAAPRDLRPQLPALLALPRAPHLHGGLVVVRRGDQVQGPHGRAQPGDHLGARARQGRPVRQVARERPRLVDLAKPVLGQPDPGVAVGQPRYPRIDVYGSFEELERDFGRMRERAREPDLHRPFIDHLTRPNPDDPTGNSTMRRVEDVLDVWFDSGSMSFAQVHYPFENAEWFEHHFPGDFIVEYIGQTRGWFYTLHVLATALFDRPAFSSCISHGIVLGSDGQKMSKSLKNYPDVSEVFNRDGADAMRWFLMSSGILRGSNLVVTEEGIREGVRQVLIPLWNSWSFFSLYANARRREGLHGPVVDRLDRPARPLPAREAGRVSRRCRARWTPTTSRAPASRCASSSTP